MPEVTVDHNV